MNKAETNKLFGYIAGGLMAAYGAWVIIPVLHNLSGGLISFRILMLVLGCVLVAVGLFFGKDFLSIGGLALIIISEIILIILYCSDKYFNLRFSYPAILERLLNIGGFALLLFALWKKDFKSSTYCYVAASLLLVSYFLYGVIMFYQRKSFGGNDSLSSFFTFKAVFWALLKTLSAVFIGLSLRTEKPVEPAYKTSDSSNTVENLTKLKSLLDSGVITQEEFDAKKKDLMGK